MIHAAFALLVAAGLATVLAGQAAPPKTLDIYVLDTEGGKATLFVAPSGETVLIDAGHAGGRDTDRILAAAAAANVTKIDYLLTSHYHADHVGGLEALVARMPVAHFLDHGPTVESQEQVQGFQHAYARAYAAVPRTIVTPADQVPLSDIDWLIVASAGHVLTRPIAGGGDPNAACEGAVHERADPADENAQSVGSVITYGRFRAVDLADLVPAKELDLMCPLNPIGRVDLYLVSHHGTDWSGSTPLVHGLRPRVAVMQNGPVKGGTIHTYETLRSSPAFEDVWQTHWSNVGMLKYNPPAGFIANLRDTPTIAEVLTARPRALDPADHRPAYWIKISAQPDGTFTVTNARNGFSRTYETRH